MSSLAVLDDNATTCYGAFFPMVILVGLPIGFGVTVLSNIAPRCKIGYFLFAECIFIELATAFALVVRFLTVLCAGRFNLCDRLNVAATFLNRFIKYKLCEYSLLYYNITGERCR